MYIIFKAFEICVNDFLKSLHTFKIILSYSNALLLAHTSPPPLHHNTPQTSIEVIVNIYTTIYLQNLNVSNNIQNTLIITFSV